MSELNEYYPVRASEFELNDDLVTVLYKKEKATVVEKLFFRKHLSKPYKIELDEIGSFVWNLCDSTNKVSDIIKLSEEKFGESVQPAENRVHAFITQLNKNRFIKLYEKKNNGDS